MKISKTSKLLYDANKEEIIIMAMKYQERIINYQEVLLKWKQLDKDLKALYCGCRDSSYCSGESNTIEFIRGVNEN